MNFRNIIFLLIGLAFCALNATAQQVVDSSSVKKDTSLFVQGAVLNKVAVDSSKPKHSPHKAAVRSAIIPGWGQVYNGKFWKVPIVYTAIGIPAGLFFYNKKWYDRTNYAYAVALSPNPTPDSLKNVHPDLLWMVENHATTTLVTYRNDFRKSMDYCVLFFLLAWALNIVDATVDAHLRDFNVSPDLSLHFKPILSNNNYGAGLVLDFRKAKVRQLPN